MEISVIWRIQNGIVSNYNYLGSYHDTPTNYLAKLELRIFSIQSKPHQNNIRKNHVVLGMAKKAVNRRDFQ